MDMLALQADDSIEIRVCEMLRHQRDGVAADFANLDADRIARQLLQHAYARDRVRVGDGNDTIDEFG
jgi:hypothetical protein